LDDSVNDDRMQCAMLRPRPQSSSVAKAGTSAAAMHDTPHCRPVGASKKRPPPRPKSGRSLHLKVGPFRMRHVPKTASARARGARDRRRKNKRSKPRPPGLFFTTRPTSPHPHMHTAFAALLLGRHEAPHEPKPDVVVHRVREPRRPRQRLLLAPRGEALDRRPQVLVLVGEAVGGGGGDDEALQEEGLWSV
jgi:hypothetical protein